MSFFCSETGGALPSIITDHADIQRHTRNQSGNNDLKLVMPPIITHTDATPRGSPKSELCSPSPNFLFRGSYGEVSDYNLM